MKFTLRSHMLDEFFRARVGPKVTAPLWAVHQIGVARNVYLPRFRAASDRKPLVRIGAELAALTAKWRCLPFHYFRYELYDRSLSFEQVAAYLPDTVFYSRLLPVVNRAVELLDDKVACKRILADAGIPQPPLLMTGERSGLWLDRSGDRVPTDSASTLDAALDGAGEVVIKPARYTSGGAGVTVVCNEHGMLRQQDGSPFSLAAYGQEWGGWLIEAFVHQHRELAAFNPHSLNTFRAITALGPDGAHVLYVLIKSSTGVDAVDNACNGGLYARVDPATGTVDEIAHTTALVRHRRHPVTGLAFAEQRITTISQVVATAERAAVHFPKTPIIGWDIAVDQDGRALIIEGNSSPSLMNLQRSHGGLAAALGRSLIDDRRPS
ncbi:sugar-transfer associated ATP-grasp domain-containing protein [Sphaerisporangium sp. NPDC051011]|uniref:sugar-transfer associated ATP-grasp domain-containing protein n=1 Tax=Sphaerisporangium sp. NPDC051011 TaxID=3155792 RepID=UPI00340F5FAA